MFSEAKADLIKGSITAVASGGFSFTTDVMPFISEIGVCAGTIVALHGVYLIIKTYILRHKDKPKDD